MYPEQHFSNIIYSWAGAVQMTQLSHRHLEQRGGALSMIFVNKL